MSLREIFERIQAIKSAKKASDRTLAEALEVSERTVQNFNAGKSQPKAVNLAALGKNWGIDLNWLLTGRGSMFYSDRHLIESDSSGSGDSFLPSPRERVVDKYVEQYGPKEGLEIARLVLGENDQ